MYTKPSASILRTRYTTVSFCWSNNRIKMHVVVVFPMPGVPKAQTRFVFVASITLSQKFFAIFRTTTLPLLPVSISITLRKTFIPLVFSMPLSISSMSKTAS